MYFINVSKSNNKNAENLIDSEIKLGDIPMVGIAVLLPLPILNLISITFLRKIWRKVSILLQKNNKIIGEKKVLERRYIELLKGEI
jgi:hypothetical protein